MKVPNKVLNTVAKVFATLDTEKLDPQLREDCKAVIVWATEGLNKRTAMAAQPRPEAE